MSCWSLPSPLLVLESKQGLGDPSVERMEGDFRTVSQVFVRRTAQDVSYRLRSTIGFSIFL